MAAGLPPYDLPASALGVQLTFFTPGAGLGIGSIAAAYDLGPVHFDAIFGLLFDEAGPNSVSGGLRGYVLVHRGPVADFSLGVGGAVGYIDALDGSTALTWRLNAGAKIRSFVGKNRAIIATLGFGATFVDEVGAVVVGGRLLGTAGFFYFLR